MHILTKFAPRLGKKKRSQPGGSPNSPGTNEHSGKALSFLSFSFVFCHFLSCSFSFFQFLSLSFSFFHWFSLVFLFFSLLVASIASRFPIKALMLKKCWASRRVPPPHWAHFFLLLLNSIVCSIHARHVSTWFDCSCVVR